MDQSQPQAKLRMHIGANELEIEAAPEMVREILAEWKRMIGLGPAEPVSPAPADAARATQLPPTFAALIGVDPERNVQVLRHLPRGRGRNGEAALVLLHAFEAQHGESQNGMPARQLLAALHASGLRVRRLDRVLARYVAAGFVIKHGTHQHEHYRISAGGRQRATRQVDLLAARLKSG